MHSLGAELAADQHDDPDEAGDEAGRARRRDLLVGLPEVCDDERKQRNGGVEDGGQRRVDPCLRPVDEDEWECCVEEAHEEVGAPMCPHGGERLPGEAGHDQQPNEAEEQPERGERRRGHVGDGDLDPEEG